MPTQRQNVGKSTRRTRRLGERVERREAAGKGTVGANAKLTKARTKLQKRTNRLAGRTAERQEAGLNTGKAQGTLGRAAFAGADVNGVPNFAAGANAPTAGAAPVLTAPPPTPGVAQSPLSTAGVVQAPPLTPGVAQSPPGAVVAGQPGGFGPGPQKFNLPGSPGDPSAGGGSGPPSEFQGVLDQQFGEGNPFAPGALPGIGELAGELGGSGSPFEQLPDFGLDPIRSAARNAQNLLNQNIAGQQASFAGRGLGNSSRAALSRGAAIGNASASLGDVLSQRGLATRQQDLDRILAASTGQAGINQSAAGTALGATLGAGGLQLQSQDQILAALGQLGNQGAGISSIGAQEQLPPSLTALMQALGLFPTGSTQSSSSGRSISGVFV